MQAELESPSTVPAPLFGAGFIIHFGATYGLTCETRARVMDYDET